MVQLTEMAWTGIFLALVAGATFGCAAGGKGAVDGAAVQGPFQPTWQSLERYEVPDWYRDAKFGIFVHWGPETLRGTDKYGPANGPKPAWKDLATGFTGEKFDADRWAELFRKSGAKYVVPVAEHHDAYALYDSSLTPFSSVKMGPKRDIVGELAAAVRRQGLIFGASSHTEEHWWFYADPPKKAPPAPKPGTPPAPQPDKAFLDWWYARLIEIVDKYHPQIFYFDWCIEQPGFEPYLRKFASYYYNRAAEWKQGVVVNHKYEAFPPKTAVLDIAVGTNRISWRPESVHATVWQFDTMSNRRYWFWRADMEVRPVAELIAELADVVSKNGNLLLNFPPAPDGTFTPEQEKALLEMGRWLSVNGEAIYGTRPWQTYGEGPTEGLGPLFREGVPKTPYTSADIRFTLRPGSGQALRQSSGQASKGDALYAIVLAWPEDRKVNIKSLAAGSALARREIKSVRLLGSDATIKWNRGADSLVIDLPAQKPCDHAYVLKIESQ